MVKLPKNKVQHKSDACSLFPISELRYNSQHTFSSFNVTNLDFPNNPRTYGTPLYRIAD